MTQAKVDVYDLVDAVMDYFAVISDAIARANETMPEAVNDRKVFLINWSEIEGAAKSRTSVNTFGGGLQLRRIVVQVSLLTRQRNQAGEGVAETATYTKDVIGVLEAQGKASQPFGIDGVHSFHWTGRQGVIPYGGVDFAGAIFSLEFLTH